MSVWWISSWYAPNLLTPDLNFLFLSPMNKVASFLKKVDTETQINLGHLWVSCQISFTFPKLNLIYEEKSFFLFIKHGWTSKELGWGKEARHKRIHIVWLHLHKILEKTKPLGQQANQWLPRVLCEGDWPQCVSSGFSEWWRTSAS